MPTVDVVDLTNKKVGSVELADDVFGVEVNTALLHESVRHYLASTRAGTHKVKGRSEIRASGKKLWRQKGTGRARMGTVASPIWRSGGTVHGPQPRDYSYKLNRKMQLGALRSALTAKLADGGLKVVDGFELSSPKTKEFDAALTKLEAGRKVLLVDNEENENLELASRNIPGVAMLDSAQLHPYHLLGAETILITKATAEKCNEALKGGKVAEAPVAVEVEADADAADDAQAEEAN